MGFQYKPGVNILQMLKDAGYNTNRIKNEGLLSQSTLQKIRDGKMISLSQIERICQMIGCYPNEIIEYIP